MAKFMVFFFVSSLILCVILNVVAFFAEKINKKRMKNIAKKDS